MRLAAPVEGALQEGLDLGMEALADAAHLRAGDACIRADRRHHGVNLAGGEALDPGLHDHGIQGLIDPPPGSRIIGEKLPERSLGSERGLSPTWVVSMGGRLMSQRSALPPVIGRLPMGASTHKRLAWRWTLHLLIQRQFKGCRQIPVLATVQEIGHGRGITWTLRAKEDPEHIHQATLGTSPEALLRQASNPGASWVGTGSATPDPMRTPSAIEGMALVSGDVSKRRR